MIASLTPSQKTELAQDLEEMDRREREERSRTFRPIEPTDPNEFGVPSNDQIGLWLSDADELWAWGGNRSSKTEFGAQLTNSFCIGEHPVRSAFRKPPVKCRACAPKWRDGVEGVLLQKFKEIVQRKHLRGGAWHKAWVEKEHKLHYANGSWIQFKSNEEDLNTYGGADLDLVWQDEHAPESYYRENKARLADRDGFYMQTFTPELGVVWEDNHINEPPVGVTVDYRFFSTFGNPYLNPEGVRKFAASLKDENVRKVKLYGEPIPLTGRVVPQFDKDRSVVPDRGLHKSAYRVIVMDFHRKIPGYCAWFAWEPTDQGGERLVMYRAMIGWNQDNHEIFTVEDWKKEIRRVSVGEKIHDWWFDEPDGGDTLDFRRNKSACAEFNDGPDKLPFRQVKKTPGLFNQAVFAMWDMFKVDPITHQPDIFIFESCLHKMIHANGKYHGNVAWELERWRYKQEKKADDETLREQVVDRDNHYISDLRYAINNRPGLPDNKPTGPKIVLPKGYKLASAGARRGGLV